MPFPSLSFLEQVDAQLKKILQSFNAQITGFLAVEHKDTGAHAAVTADTLTLAAVATPKAPKAGGTLYIDKADGDLKIIFANGTIKTIATN